MKSRIGTLSALICGAILFGYWYISPMIPSQDTVFVTRAFSYSKVILVYRRDFGAYPNSSEEIVHAQKTLSRLNSSEPIYITLVEKYPELRFRRINVKDNRMLFLITDGYHKAILEVRADGSRKISKKQPGFTGDTK